MAENNTQTMKTSLQENMDYLNQVLLVDVSFDLVYRVIHVGGKEACIYFIDGFWRFNYKQDAKVYRSRGY